MAAHQFDPKNPKAFHSAAPTVSSKPQNEPITESAFQKLLTNFVLENNISFRVVESDSFRKLINGCSSQNSSFKIPCQTTLREWIRKEYEKEKAEIKKELQETPGKVNFIIDGWSSKNHHAFQGVVATWIDANWILNTCLLDMTILKGNHSGANMAAAFANTIEEFGLWDKLLSVTTDNAGNMDTFATEFEKICAARGHFFRAEDHRVRCLAHIINLVCKDVLNGINGKDTVEVNLGAPPAGVPDSLVEKIRKGVVAINSSNQRLEKFDAFCQVAKLKTKALLRDVSTRWNSTYRMLSRILELQEPYKSTLSFFTDLSDLNPSEEEWNKIKDLLKILKPFEDVTLVMSLGNSVTISDTAAVYQFLFEHLEQYCLVTKPTRTGLRNHTLVPVLPSEHPAYLRNAAIQGREKLKKYFPSADGLVCVVATGRALPYINCPYYK